MVNPNRFYTYAYLREDRTPYYIGKGKGKRAYRKYKGETIKPPKDKSRIIYLKQNLTEEEAFKHEIYMIAVLGRKDLGTGILRNKSNGGEGPSGWVASEETRRKMGEAQKGKTLSEETRKKIGEALKGNTIWLGKSHSEESKRKISEALKGNTTWLGRTHSEESKRKISEAKKGKTPWLGKTHSEESKAKMSAANKGQISWNKGKTLSEETKAKISKAKKGKISWNKGKTLSEETKEKMLERKRELFAKTYHLISPEKEEIVVKTTLREFCREYGLERTSLTKVLKGKANHHKGWTVPQVAQDT
jgi:hypothetical protein